MSVMQIPFCLTISGTLENRIGYKRSVLYRILSGIQDTRLGLDFFLKLIPDSENFSSKYMYLVRRLKISSLYFDFMAFVSSIVISLCLVGSNEASFCYNGW